MLSYEFMGVLALWVLWINTALIAGAAALDLRRLRRPYGGYRRLEAGSEGLGVVRGVVEAAGAPLARLTVARTGRLADGPKLTIQFGAQAPSSTLCGGAVRVGERALRLDPGPSRVWLEPREIEAALGRYTEAELAEAEAQARRRKGYRQTAALDVAAGREVFVAGRFAGGPEPGDWRVLADDETPVLISTIDPARFVARQTVRTVAFVAGMFAVLAGITGLALTEPLFGPVSKLGGVLGLAYFLLVLPAATALRERTRTPDTRSYFGLWKAERPSPLAPGAVERT